MKATFDVDPRLLAIDPRGCGCTECMIGEYRPIDQASSEEIAALVAGRLADHTNSVWTADPGWHRTTITSSSYPAVWTVDDSVPVALNSDGTAHFGSAYALVADRRSR